jgi:hypothetical protein
VAVVGDLHDIACPESGTRCSESGGENEAAAVQHGNKHEAAAVEHVNDGDDEGSGDGDIGNSGDRWLGAAALEGEPPRSDRWSHLF